jgi:hypothetical protein
MPNPAIDDVYEPEEKPTRSNAWADGRGPDLSKSNAWSDHAKAAQMGARGVVSAAGAAARYVGEKYDLPTVTRKGREAQTYAREENEETAETMSPAARARLESSLGDEAFMSDIIGSLGLKLSGSAPAVVATAVPAALVSGAAATTLAVAGAGAAINAAMLTDELYAQTDSLNDQQLQQQSPVYSKLREGMDETTAREEFNGIVRGLAPVYVAAISAATAGFGPAGQLVRVARGAGASATKGGAARAFGEGAASEFIEEGAQAYGSQSGAVNAGAQENIDRGRVIVQALEGAALGGIMGGALGMTPGGARNADRPAPSRVEVPRRERANTQPPSTAPAVNPDPESPNSNIKTEATQAAPSVQQPGAPRRRPGKTPTPTVPEGVPTTVAGAPPAVEIVNPVGVDSTVAAALAPQAAPVANQNVPVAPAQPRARPQPPVPANDVTAPAAVDTPFGPLTTPTPPAAAQAQPVTPAGNVVPPELPPGGAEPVPAAVAVSGRPSSGAARAPRILEDVRPEAVELARDDQFQQNEAVRSNLAAMRAAERGPAGRTDLYGKRGEKRRADAKAAQGLFEKHVNDDIVIPDGKNVDQRMALKRRVDGILTEAKEAGITIPTRIDYDGTEPTADHLVWLREVADMQKAFNGKTPPTQERMMTFLLRERAAKDGDFSIMKSERRSEGDQKARASQGDVEKLAGNATQIAAAQQEAGDDTVAAPVASAASAEADAVPTVASKTKRGAVRDEKSESKAASPVRKIELSDEEKKEYAARLLGQQANKEQLAGRVVDDAKFTKEVAKKAAAPVAEKPATPEPATVPEPVPPKVTPPVTPKVATVKQKVEAAAKRVEKTPSKAKIDANNFTKGHVSIQGLPITIETARGELREGTTRGGKKWSVKMPAHYGEIKRTEGADGDPLDVYIGPKPDSDYVLVIEQNDAATGRFDELKSFVGYAHMNAALEDYVASFSDGRGAERFGEFRNMTMAEFKEFAKTAQTKKPLDQQGVAAEATQDALQDEMSAPTPVDTAPAVELDELDLRRGPRIPNTKEHAFRSYSAQEALDQFVTLEGIRGLQKPLMPLMKRAIGRALANTDVKVHFVDDATFARLYHGTGTGTAGFYDSAMKHVIIRDFLRLATPEQQAHVVMHELAHAATVGKLDEERLTQPNLSQNKNSATYQLTSLFLDVKRQILERGENMPSIWGADVTPEKIYALKNIREFVAEAMTNKDFQDLLAKINVSPDVALFLNLEGHQKASLWRAFVETIRKILGMPPGTYSALEATLNISERLTYYTQPDREAQYLDNLTGASRADRAPQTMAQRLLARRRAQRAIEENAAEVEGMTGMRVQDAFEVNLREMLGDARTNVSRSIGDPKWLRMRSMTDMAQLAKSYFRGNSVRRVVNAIEAIRVTGNEIAREADPVLNDLISAQRKYKNTPAFEQLLEVMHDATMAGVHPDRDLAANTQLGKKSMRGTWGRAQHAALQQRYNSLPADLKSVYQKSLKYFQDQHNAVIRQSLENQVLKALGFNDAALADRIFNDTTTEADKELLGDLYEVVVESGKFAKERGPYFPLKRFGNFVVRGTYQMAEPTTPHRRIDENTFEFDTKAAAEAFVAKQQNRTSLKSVYVDEATGSLYFLDDRPGKEGRQVRVHKEDVDAVQRFRVQVQNRHLEFFENRAEAEERKAELEQEGVSMEPVQMRRDDPRQAVGDLLSTDMERLMRRIEARDNFKEMSDFQKNEVRKAVEEASYAALASTRIQTSRIQRRYVEGASKDIIRSTAEYAGSMSGYLARYQHMAELDSALKEMNKEADTGGDPATAMGRSTIRNEVMYRINQPNIAPSQHNGKMDQWRHRLLVTSFVSHLASPAYSLINATQPMMVTTPVLGARHGLGSTVAAMTKAYADMGSLRTVASGVSGTVARARDSQANTNTYVSDILSRLTNSKEKAMIGHLVKHGAIDADSGMEVGRLINQSTGDQWLSYFENISRQMPMAVEAINRFASALAAYRLEMKRNGGDHDAAVQYAQEIVESTQGIYAATNVPPVFSSPIASIAFQFKKYGHLIYSLLGQQIGKAIRNENVGDRAEAIKALGFLVGAHVTMAGTVGLPTEPIKLMLMGANAVGLTGLTMEDFEEWERELAQSVFGDDVAEMVTHGVFRGLPGGLSMDLSQRMGMQSYLTFGAPDSSEEGDIWAWLGETAAGAPGGMMVDALQGAKNIASGDVVKGMEQLVPVKVIKDGIKAYQQATEGKVSKSGRQTLTPLSMPEAAMRLFGITPGRAAETQLAQGSFYRNTGRLREERLQLQYDFASAKGSARQKVWREIQDWNKGQPANLRLSYSQLTSYVRRREEEDRATTMGGMRVTDRERAVFERIDRIYNQ